MEEIFEKSYEKVNELAICFERNLPYYKSPQYQEAEVRKDYIDKFFIALGWDVNHKEQKNPYKQEVKIEKSQIQEGEKGKKFADYAFYLAPDFKNPVFFAEAKKPSVILENNKHYYLQTHKYGWNSKVPISILTDFEEFIIIDCRTKPNPKYSENNAIRKYNFKDYCKENKFREIYYLFSREAVAEGSIKNFVEYQIPQTKQRIRQLQLFGGYRTVDDDFLNYIDELRSDLANGFLEKNPRITSKELTEATQKTIDRLVFTRFLEDKQIEFESLITKLRKWKDFISLSKTLDNKYNGIVYKKGLIDNPKFLGIDDGIFTDICIDISSNESPYNFNFIPIHILGNIYERFLGKIVIINNGEVEIVPKPEVRKAGGVFYTPKYIVDYIVEKTVGSTIKGKTPKEIDEMHFADISCGSGSFLIGVYEKLIDYHKEYYQKKLKNKNKLTKASEDYGNVEFKEGAWIITLKRKQEILLNSIFGVDIDNQAVEVTQLSLFLKLLEDESLSIVNKQHTFFSKVLPDLSENIQCGNSLVGWDIIDYYSNDDELAINPFDFKMAFPKVFNKPTSGFDTIIGNPPYVKEYTDRNAFTYPKKSYLQKYYQGKMDLWYFFVCNGIDLLKENGLLGYIAPNNWTTNAGASIMRNKIIRDSQILEMIDFGNYLVFKDASIQTMILLLKKSKKTPTYKLLYSKLVNHHKRIGDAISLLKQEINKNNVTLIPELIRNDYINNYILFGEKNKQSLLKKIQGKANFILDPHDEVAQGIVAPQDSVNRKNSKKLNIPIGTGIFVISTKEKESLNLSEKELSLIQPLYTTEELHNFDSCHNNKYWIIYTDSSYKNKDSLNEYPNIKKHLDKFRSIITSDNEPYGLHRARKEYFFKGEKIIALRKCSDSPIFSYVNFDSYVTQTFYIIKSNRINLKYLTGILNSSLIKFWLKHRGKMQGNNYQIDKIPLLEIPINLSQNKEMINQLSTLVEKIIETKKQQLHVTTSHDIEYYKRKVRNIKMIIDKLVYQLYELSEEEIIIIEKD